ncbi:MAG: hypothetical protein B7Y95_05585, partial [Rhizobiales bacterium 32-66-11]
MTARVRVIVKLAAVLGIALSAAMATTAGSILIAGPAAAQSASSIVVEGNRRVDAATIRSYFAVKPGESLSPAKINEGLAALYATGLFSDVNISHQGGRLVVRV